MEKLKGFYAYGSKPTHCGEFIEEAIKEINAASNEVTIKSWKQMNAMGELLISEILKEIQNADFFCADITDLNENVLFELGFAIGKGKKIWVTQDTSIIQSYNKFRELNLFTSVGYLSYTKSEDIVNRFLEKKEYSIEQNILEDFLGEKTDIKETHALLYLKSQFDTNYNQFIINRIKDSKLPAVIDDAVEVKVQPFTWYIEQILRVPAILVEFSSTNRTGYELQNAKCSFVAGLALGLNLKILMISERPYTTSIDYQEYLKKFSDLDLCRNIVDSYLANVRSNIAEWIINRPERITSQRNVSALHAIKFGEFIAEHEANNIYDYYIERAHESNLIKSEYNIVVGRKGCGKTATLYFLEKEVHRDVRNEVIPIKPVNFEIDGLLQILDELQSDFEKGYIIQAIWKFLIYTEVIKEIYEIVKLKPLYALNPIDNDIIEFVENHSNIILCDFSTRLENEFHNMEILKEIKEQTLFRNKISEILHDGIISTLKDLIIAYMNKRKKLVILIDNLDKNWRKGANIELTSKFILGLLSVIGRISKELKGNPKKPNEFSLNLLVFLRSDIFRHVLEGAREPDKLEFYNLNWADNEVLIRVVNRRLEKLSKMTDAEQFWNNNICKTIDGVPVREYILSCIIPRPRDIIYFLNAAKSIAMARGHDIITRDDIIAAHQDYSAWVFKSLLVENGVTIDQLHSFLYNTMGETSVLNSDDIERLMIESGILLENITTEYFIEHLCSLSFLGRETKPFAFSYDYDLLTNEKNMILAKKLGTNRYKIHNAFLPYLECSDYRPND